MAKLSTSKATHLAALPTSIFNDDTFIRLIAYNMVSIRYLYNEKWIFGTKNYNTCICTVQFQSSVSVWYSIKKCLSFFKHRCISQAQHFTLDWCLHSDCGKFCLFPLMAQSLQSLSSTLIGQCPNCMFSLVKLLYWLLRGQPAFFLDEYPNSSCSATFRRKDKKSNLLCPLFWWSLGKAIPSSIYALRREHSIRYEKHCFTIFVICFLYCSTPPADLPCQLPS